MAAAAAWRSLSGGHSGRAEEVSGGFMLSIVFSRVQMHSNRIGVALSFLPSSAAASGRGLMVAAVPRPPWRSTVNSV